MEDLRYLKCMTTGEQHSLEGNMNLIGRAPTSNIVINHTSISKDHALISIDGEGNASLKDLNSLNGTTVNDRKVKNGQSIPLKNSDIISFGKDPNSYIFVDEAIRSGNEENVSSTSMDRKIVLIDKTHPHAKIDHFKNIQSMKESNSFPKFKSPDPVPKEFTQSKPEPQRKPPTPIKTEIQNKLEDSLDDENNFNQNNPNIFTFQKKTPADSQILKKQNLQLEEKSLQQDAQIKKLMNQNESLAEENEKLKAKNKVIELYASQLQRKVDNMSLDLREKEELLQTLNNEDWSKRIIESNNEIEMLRQHLVNTQSMLQEFKSQLASSIKSSSTSAIPNDHSSHFERFIDQQSTDLLKSKKIIKEYEMREENCMKKWNSLLQENLKHCEKINGLKMQLQRQKETFQQSISKNHNQIAHLNNSIPQIMNDNDPKKKAAAHFLVDQMNIISIYQDKQKILLENEDLHLQIQEILDENQDLKKQLSSNLGLSQTKDLYSETDNLKMRIEELEDIIYEMKQEGSIPKIIQLQQLNENLEIQLAQHQAKIKEIYESLKKRASEESSGNVFNKEEALEYYSNLMREKDLELENLNSQLNTIQAMKNF